MKLLKTSINIALYCTFLLCTSTQGQGFISYVPGSRANAEGNTAGSRPFIGTTRYQQVINSSEFEGLPAGGGYVRTIWFRADSFVTGSQSAIIPRLQINLSTTSRAADSLSPVFSENIGPDDKIVFGPSTKTLVTTSSGSFPNHFEVAATFTFDVPFLYDPAKGNLLFDVINYEGAGVLDSLLLDAHAEAGDSTSAVFALQSDALTGNIANARSLVMLIHFTPVPEPDSAVLLGIGAVGIILGRVWRMASKRKGGMNVPD